MGTLDTASLGARIRERRLEKGLTQAQVGAPDLTGGYVSLIECGHRKPSQGALRLIAARLDMELDEPIHLRVDAITGAARCLRFMGDARMAVHTLDSYRRDLMASRPDPHALMKTYTELIQGYFAIGLPENARDAAHAALRLEGQIDDPDEIACMHLTLARTLMYEGRFGDALVSVRKAHEIYSGGKWRNKAAKALLAEGIVLSKKSDYALARERLTEALELLAGSPNRLDEVLALNELGRIDRCLDNPTDALARLEQARTLLQNGEILEQAFNEREIGLSLALLGKPGAETHLRHAFDLYRAAGATDDLAATCKALGDVYLAKGDMDRAVATLREGLEYIELRSS